MADASLTGWLAIMSQSVNDEEDIKYLLVRELGQPDVPFEQAVTLLKERYGPPKSDANLRTTSLTLGSKLNRDEL